MSPSSVIVPEQHTGPPLDRKQRAIAPENTRIGRTAFIHYLAVPCAPVTCQEGCCEGLCWSLGQHKKQRPLHGAYLLVTARAAHRTSTYITQPHNTMAAPREHAVPIHVPARPGNHTTPDEIAEDSGSSWPRSWKTASDCYSGSASRRSSGSFMDRVGQLRQRSAASPAQRPGSLDIRAEAPSTSQLYTPFQSPALASQGKPVCPSLYDACQASTGARV
jgi:hypothetical protein